jgi:spore coat protein U-like protein
MKLTKLFLFLASISALVISSDGSVLAAGSATKNLAVSANVIQSCSIATTAVTFVDYDPTATSPNDSGQGTVTIACTKGVAPTIGLGFGQNASGTQRSMLQVGAAAKLLQYGLYQEAARTTAWGDGTAGGGTVLTLTAVPDNNPITKQIYGRIAALQNVPNDTYNDLVLASVNF